MSALNLHERIDQERLPADQQKKLFGLGAVLAGVGVLAAAAGFVVDGHRYIFSYFVGFMWLCTIGLGGLFFVLLEHLVKAAGLAATRRHAEWVMWVLPVCVVLFIPIVLFGHDLWHHWMEMAPDDAVLQAKAAWLNAPAFWIRSAIYLGSWVIMVLYLTRMSDRQDATGDLLTIERVQRGSAPAILIFAFTLTFAGFDWVMSLDPHWYSTIFGVYIFGGAFGAGMSVLALLALWLQGQKLLNKVSTVEHRHDIGKLMFAFTVFWAYIAFSQFMLIWYANIPEETIWYAHRWEHGWNVPSLTLLFIHFIIPFLLLLSRRPKRSVGGLLAGAVIILCAHWLDLYWLILPTHEEHFHLSWMDFAAMILPIGVLLTVIAWRAGKTNLYPLKDPRLGEAYKLENL